VPLYALTIFCGAFLLFLVQPLMGKYLLPWFGGGPGVWTTCLLFFQTLLLGGYAYAHFLQRLTPKRQTLIHLLLLAAALAFLPVVPGAQWKPTGTEEPVGRILLLLTATLGLPYLVLSATGPLLQRWFSLSHPGVSPYRLYALSNVGSLLALVAYPFFFEPRFSRSAVGLGWSAGLGVFAVLCGACAWRVRNAAASSPVAGVADPGGQNKAPGSTTPATAPAEAKPAPLDRFLWFTLPALASLLLAAATNKLCLDIAAIPFLWVLPLGVYLLTFILCFDHPRWYSRGAFIALLAVCALLLAHLFSIPSPKLYQQLVTFIGTLFAACMVCHGELHRLRPAPGRLTGYYLAIAAGGAGGTLCVTLIAPLLFSDYRELQLGLVMLPYFLGVLCWLHRSRAIPLGLAAGLVAFGPMLAGLRADRGEAWYDWFVSFGRELGQLVTTQWPALLISAVVLVIALWGGLRRDAPWRKRLLLVPALLTGLLATVFTLQAKRDRHETYAAERNFYGAYRVGLFDEAPAKEAHFLVLSNGGTTHGQQFLNGQQQHWPTTYYSETSGVGRAISVLPGGRRRIGAVGLGTGTIAAYGRPGDTLRFYEINPAIVGVASRTFAYLKNTRATVSIALGDARLVMERELRSGSAQQFDLLVLDAFSGDAIPVHLLTREALALYVRQLRPGGIIAVHISNRHLDLRPVVEGLAQDAGLNFATIHDTVKKEHWWLYDTDWVLLSPDPAILQRDPIRTAPLAPSDPDDRIVWTDEHASLLSVVK